MLATLQTLKISGFRYLLAGRGLNVVGIQILTMTQAWLVLALTDSDGWVGAVNGLPAVPVVFVVMLGGVLADRTSRQTMLMCTRLSQAAIGILAAVLVSLGLIELWHLVVMSFLFAFSAAWGSTADQALIADVVPEERLFSGNTLFSSVLNVGRFAGPALGGVLIARMGVAGAYYATGVITATAAFTTFGIRARQPERSGQKATFLADLREGVRYTWNTKALRWLILAGLMLAFGWSWVPLMPRYARDVMHVGAEGYGTILAAHGIGGLVAALTLVLKGEFRSIGKLLTLCPIIFAVLVVPFAFSTSIFLSAVIAFAFGVVIIWWANGLRIGLQLLASEEMRGRVMSLYVIITQMLTLAWLVGGTISEVMGPRAAMITGAAIFGLAFALAYVRSPELRTLGE